MLPTHRRRSAPSRPAHPPPSESSSARSQPPPAQPAACRSQSSASPFCKPAAAVLQSLLRPTGAAAHPPATVHSRQPADPSPLCLPPAVEHPPAHRCCSPPAGPPAHSRLPLLTACRSQPSASPFCKPAAAAAAAAVTLQSVLRPTCAAAHLLVVTVPGLPGRTSLRLLSPEPGHPSLPCLLSASLLLLHRPSSHSCCSSPGSAASRHLCLWALPVLPCRDVLIDLTWSEPCTACLGCPSAAA